MDILSTLASLIRSSVGGDPSKPPLPTVLTDIAADLERLTELDLEPSGEGLERWLATFHSITGNVTARETLVIRVLQVHLPRVAETLALAGVMGVTWNPDASPRSFTINWDALRAFTRDPGSQAITTLLNRVPSVKDAKAVQALMLLLLASPVELVAREYARAGFLSLPVGDGVSLDDLVELINSPIAVPLGQELLTRLQAGTLVEWLQQLKEQPGGFPTVAPRLAVLRPDPPAAGLAGLELRLDASSNLVRSARVALPVGWVLTGDVRGDATVSARIVVTGGGFDVSPAVRPDAQVGFFLSKARKADDDAFLLGRRGGTFVAVRDIRLGLTVAARPSDPTAAVPLFALVTKLDGLRLGVGTDLLKPLAAGLALPGSITFSSDFSLPYLQGVGVQGAGTDGIGIDIPTPLGFALGGPGLGLWLDDMLTRLEVAISPSGLFFRTLFRFDARAEIGPLKATVTGAGMWLGRWMSGNAGVLEPTGIGLSLDAGPVSGGGFVGKLGPGEFGGALTLKILGIGAFAFGIYKELPGGPVSFVAVIGIRLPPPGIQIGFGFAVSGIGGLIGIHRRADTDKLREKLVSGTAGDVLFTDDPTRNAPRILGELRTLFPDERGTFIIGPTLQLNWLYLFTLDVGVFIELPGPRKIFVAGSARLVVGSEDFALVYLRMDFIGGIDATASLIFFDGALVNSHILGILRITGGLALRIGFGPNPYFLFSVGGFHPQFAPGGLAVPQIPRAGAGVDLGIVWFTQEMYYAVTSNTVQFGTRTEAGIRLGPIRVHGWFGFDALIQFRPFRFTARIDAGMSATFAGWEFASIRVRGELSGPGPLVLRAEASVKVIVRISKNVTITLDSRPPESLPAISNLAQHLAGEISTPENLRGDGDDPDVVFAGASPTIIPVGRVIWEQHRIPLDRVLHKAEGVPLGSGRTLGVACAEPGAAPLAIGVEEDEFAVGTYTNLSDAEALSAPTFSRGRSGFSLEVAQAHATSATTAPCSPGLNLLRLPRRRFVILDFSATLRSVHAGLVQSILERDRGAAVMARPTDIVLTAERWTTPVGGAQHAADAFLAARATGSFAVPTSTPSVSLEGVL